MVKNLGGGGGGSVVTFTVSAPPLKMHPLLAPPPLLVPLPKIVCHIISSNYLLYSSVKCIIRVCGKSVVQSSGKLGFYCKFMYNKTLIYRLIYHLIYLIYLIIRIGKFHSQCKILNSFFSTTVKSFYVARCCKFDVANNLSYWLNIAFLQ